MPVFAIVSTSDPAKIRTVLNNKFAENHIQLPRGSGWLVFAPNATAQEVSNQLGVSEGESGTGIVFAIAGYWGRAPTNVWEWLSVKIVQH